MAVEIISQLLGNASILFAYNNNIIRFRSNTNGFVPLYAEIIIFVAPEPQVFKLYPHPDDSFYFNFFNYAKNKINQSNFAKPNDISFAGLTEEYFQSDGTPNYYENIAYNIKITSIAEVEEELNQNHNFILGVEQRNDYLKQELTDNEDLNVLSPMASDGIHYLKYWKGYPFFFCTMVLPYSPLNQIRSYPIDMLSGAPVPMNIRNDFQVSNNYLSDGSNHRFGSDNFNLAKITNGFGKKLFIEQVNDTCGKYFMFMNKYGKWNFWLFDNGHFTTRTTKSIGKMNKDFTDIRENSSPTLSLGKTGDESIRVQGKNLSYKYKVILEQLIDSPKIYYFVGRRNEVSVNTDWIEVMLKTGSVQTENPKTLFYKYNFEFDLPDRYTQTL